MRGFAAVSADVVQAECIIGADAIASPGDGGSKSGHAKGNGEFVQSCEKCRHHGGKAPRRGMRQGKNIGKRQGQVKGNMRGAGPPRVRSTHIRVVVLIYQWVMCRYVLRPTQHGALQCAIPLSYLLCPSIQFRRARSAHSCTTGAVGCSSIGGTAKAPHPGWSFSSGTGDPRGLGMDRLDLQA